MGGSPDANVVPSMLSLFTPFYSVMFGIIQGSSLCSRQLACLSRHFVILKFDVERTSPLLLFGWYGRDNPSIAIVISQAALVILTVFGGGVFIRFDEVGVSKP